VAATMVRVVEVADPASVDDPHYAEGLRAAVAAALDYALVELEKGGRQAAAIPPALLSQARQAAGNSVSLEVVIRRCIVGHATLGDFVIEAVEEANPDLPAGGVRQIWQILAAVIDRVVVAMSDEYANEIERRTRTVAGRRMELVRMLLAGQFVESRDLHYDTDAWHIGAIAQGPDAVTVIRTLAESLDRRLLLVQPASGTVWGWLGGQRKVLARDAERHAPDPWPAGLCLALGEPERGLAGFRLTHRQARAALPIAVRPLPRMIRYVNVALLASAIGNDVLANSLQRLYLDPLAYERDGGTALRLTLRAYFESGQNASSTAAALGTSRQTVNNRLRTVEDRVGRSLDACGAELDLALRLQALGTFGPAAPADD
jgi:hypothetical protein